MDNRAPYFFVENLQLWLTVAAGKSTTVVMRSRRHQQRSESPNLVIVDGQARQFTGFERSGVTRLFEVDAAVAALTNKRERVADELERMHALRTYRSASLITSNDNQLDEVSK